MEDVPTWADRLKRERCDLGWSQKELAKKLTDLAGRLGIRMPERASLIRSIKNWESGRYQPRDPYPMLLSRVFSEEASPAEERLGLATDADRDSGYDQLRRSLDDVLTAGAMAEATLDQWDMTVLLHAEATRNKPAGVLVSDIASDFDDLRRAMDRHRSASALRRLTRVAAQMSGLMCLTFIKLDNRAAFRRWARTARIAASEAGDPLTQSWVLAQECYGHFYAGDLSEAIRVAQGAQHAAPSSVGAVLAAALEARAHAALSPARFRETRAALNRAERILDDLPASEVNNSAFGYNEAQLRFHEGNAFTHLGDTQAAWRAQQRALQLCPDSDYMDRTLTRLDRTICLARDGDTATAVEYAMSALAPLTHRQRQGIISLRGREILGVLPREQRALPAAQQLRELLTPGTYGEVEQL